MGPPWSLGLGQLTHVPPLMLTALVKNIVVPTVKCVGFLLRAPLLEILGFNLSPLHVKKSGKAGLKLLIFASPYIFPNFLITRPHDLVC